MKIEDNFLEKKEFDELQTLIMGSDIAWYFNKVIDDKTDLNKFQFTHTFYKDFNSHSAFLERLTPIIKKIKIISLWRIKANLLTKTPNIVVNRFHIDNRYLSPEKMKQWTTSIFYINSNNGYTEFEDGTKVESVANRLVTFPAKMKHRGTSCTDEKTRVVINFNYFKQ